MMMLDSLQTPLNDHGFSLIEVMIAAGILVTALLGMTEFTRVASTSNMSVQLNTDFSNLSTSILYVLSSTRLCNEALLNQPFNPKIASPPTLNAMTVGTSPLPKTTIATTGKIASTNNGLEVNKLLFNNFYGSYVTASGTNYIANMYIEAQKVMPNGKPYIGAPILSKNLVVNVLVNTATKKVLSCN
jgi:prepilin-type N-terminal cleavage/methylation domain-containing protein